MSDSKNTLALAIFGHAVARLADDAGEVLAQHERERPVAAIARFPVNRIHARGGDANEDLVRSGPRHRHVF